MKFKIAGSSKTKRLEKEHSIDDTWDRYSKFLHNEDPNFKAWERINLTEKNSLAKEWRTKDLSIPRNDIFYERRKIILSYYPPFLNALQELNSYIKSNGDNYDPTFIKEEFEQNWFVKLKSTLKENFPTISEFQYDAFAQLRDNMCVKELSKQELKNYELPIDKVVLEITPYAHPQEILRQIGEIVDNHNIEDFIQEKAKKSSISITPMIHPKDNIKKYEIMKELGVKEWPPKTLKKAKRWSHTFKSEPRESDLAIIIEHNKGLSFSEIDEKLYPDKKPDSSRIKKRLSAICKYCERFNENKSELYNKMVK